MRVCEKLGSSWWVGEWHLEKGGGGQDCGMMEGESGFREDVGGVLVTPRMKGREEAWCPRVGMPAKGGKVQGLSARSRGPSVDGWAVAVRSE